MRVLEEQKLTENTIVVFTSDHGCHFMTRNEEYKRSPHNSSIRVPLIVQGPGFNNAMTLPEIVGQHQRDAYAAGGGRSGGSAVGEGQELSGVGD